MNTNKNDFHNIYQLVEIGLISIVKISIKMYQNLFDQLEATYWTGETECRR